MTDERIDWEITKTFNDALEGDTDAALDMWRCVERHTTDPEAVAWAQIVARRILKEVQEPGTKRRPDSIMKAVGLIGRQDKHRRLRDFVEVYREFENPDRKEPSKQAEKSKELYDAIRQKALTDLNCNDPEQKFFFDYDDEYLKKIADMLDFELRKLIGRL